uniref:Uncharacterized protein n=1 Tax=Arundo donax TaxID=35708 RepID=A0A0A9B6M0_ARUDO
MVCFHSICLIQQLQIHFACSISTGTIVDF